MDYEGPLEAALTTDLRGEPFNFAVWDTQTSAQLVVFKNAKKAPVQRCLALIDNNYFLTASDNVLNIWSIYNKKCQEHKLFLPSRPNCLSVTPCSNYIIVGLSETLNIWSLRSGNLLATAQRHYQSISVIKTTIDGSLVVSGGEDGHTLVWCFADLLNSSTNLVAMKGKDNLEAGNNFCSLNEPKHSWKHHDAQVTDVVVTNSGLCLTASADASVNIYNLQTGRRLHCVVMPCELWSLALNKNETHAFVGASDGNIYEIVISDIGLSMLNSPQTNQDPQPVFCDAHKGKVNLLKVSLDGSRLISGSADSSCKIWNIRQRKLLKDVKHQGALSNLELLFVPDGLAIKSMSIVKPQLTVHQLKRTEYKPTTSKLVSSEEVFNDVIFAKHATSNNLRTYVDNNRATSDSVIHDELKNDQQTPKLSGSSTEDILREKLKNLYKFAAEKVFKDASAEIMQQFRLFDGQQVNNSKRKLFNNSCESLKKSKQSNDQ